MTLCELLGYLDAHVPYAILDGGCSETLEKVRGKTHKDEYASEVVAAIVGGLAQTGESVAITRAQATTALGPLRLRAMRDDASGEDLRRMKDIVHAIDSAFNEEALAARGS